jgi:hypothetical protein
MFLNFNFIKNSNLFIYNQNIKIEILIFVYIYYIKTIINLDTKMNTVLTSDQQRYAICKLNVDVTSNQVSAFRETPPVVSKSNNCEHMVTFYDVKNDRTLLKIQNIFHL